MITSFSGEYAFLSNFYPTQIRYGGIYPTAEHAYQAMKTLSLNERFKIAKLTTPGQVKRAGREVTLRPDWEDIKLRVMEEILYNKFHNRELAKKLIATGGQVLVEGNTWGDTYWGVCNGKGKNNLGKLLMAVRATYRKNYPDIAVKYPLPVIDGVGSPETEEDMVLQVCTLLDYAKNKPFQLVN